MAKPPNRADGMITTYYPAKGYGFVTTFDLGDGGSTDVFFHISELPGHHHVKEKWRIEFSPHYNGEEDGWEARNARIVSKRTKPGAESPERKPWYQRKESKSAAESVARNAGIKSSKQAPSDDDAADDRTKYNQSDLA